MNIRSGFVLACSLTLLTCGGSKPAPLASVASSPSSSSSSATIVVDSGIAPTPSKVVTVVSSDGFEEAVLLPSGRVLVTSRSAVFLWDPHTGAAPRRIDIADTGSQGGGALTSSGNTRFVVTRENAGKLVLDLWDAEALTKLKTLEGTWDGSAISRASFSADGTRFSYAGCSPALNRAESLDCEASVYTLPEGQLVHRTKLPTLETGIYLPQIVLSPTGRFFAISHEHLLTRAHESVSGKLVYSGSERNEVYLDDSSSLSPRLHFIFVDERRLLSSSTYGRKLEITNLETGKRVGGLDLKLTKDDFAYGHTLSPDRKRVAVLIRRGKNVGSELAMWNVDDDTSSRHTLSPSTCPDYCEVRWRSARDVVVHSRAISPETQWRLEADVGTPKDEPYELLPAFASGGFRVFGDFDVSTSVPREVRVDPKDHGEPYVKAPPAVVVTEAGANVPLPRLAPNGSALSVLGAELLLATREAVDVVSKDGSLAELVKN
jgi:hypothetical protein